MLRDEQDRLDGVLERPVMIIADDTGDPVCFFPVDNGADCGGGVVPERPGCLFIDDQAVAFVAKVVSAVVKLLP